MQINKWARRVVLATALAGLAACGNSVGTAGTGVAAACVNPGKLATIPAASFDTDTRSADGLDPCANADTGGVPNGIISQAKSDLDGTPLATANADGKTWISAHVFVPAYTPGQTFPVVLHSHGWSNHKITATTPVTAGSKSMFKLNEELTSGLYAEGYIVVSFYQRGWGDSEGEISVMDPARETQDAKAVVDWIAAEGRAGRLPVRFDDAAMTDPRLGTMGVSYGGGFQMLLAMEDPRVDTVVPFGTWHDQVYATTPHRYTNDTAFTPGVFKNAFTGGLCLLGLYNPALTSSSGNRDDRLVQGCASATPPSAAPYRFREEWDPTGALTGVLKTHGMRWYQSNPSAVSAADSKNGLAPGAGLAQRGGLPVLLVQGSRDMLFDFNQAMWNYNFFKGLAPTSEVKLLSNLSGHMSSQWVKQAVEGSNCGRLQLPATLKAWFKKYLQDDASDWAALNVPEVCMATENSGANGLTQHGVSLSSVPVGGTVVAAQTQEVTAATLGANAYVFKPVGAAIVGNDKVLAGAPRLTRLTICAPAPAPCAKASAPGTSAEQVAYVGVGLMRAGVLRLVDDQVLGIRNLDAFDGDASKTFLLNGIAETLQAGDQPGLVLFAKHPQYAPLGACTTFPSPTVDSLGPFTCAPTPADYYKFTADVELPVLTADGVSVIAHSGVEP